MDIQELAAERVQAAVYRIATDLGLAEPEAVAGRASSAVIEEQDQDPRNLNNRIQCVLKENRKLLASIQKHTAVIEKQQTTIYQQQELLAVHPVNASELNRLASINESLKGTIEDLKKSNDELVSEQIELFNKLDFYKRALKWVKRKALYWKALERERSNFEALDDFLNAGNPRRNPFLLSTRTMINWLADFDETGMTTQSVRSTVGSLIKLENRFLDEFGVEFALSDEPAIADLFK